MYQINKISFYIYTVKKQKTTMENVLVIIHSFLLTLVNNRCNIKPLCTQLIRKKTNKESFQCKTIKCEPSQEPGNVNLCVFYL